MLSYIRIRDTSANDGRYINTGCGFLDSISMTNNYEDSYSTKLLLTFLVNSSVIVEVQELTTFNLVTLLLVGLTELLADIYKANTQSLLISRVKRDCFIK